MHGTSTVAFAGTGANAVAFAGTGANTVAVAGADAGAVASPGTGVGVVASAVAAGVGGAAFLFGPISPDVCKTPVKQKRKERDPCK